MLPPGRLIDTVKRRLHRDIVADPLLHGLVLNLYMNGERYPHRVDDYFPLAAATDVQIEQLMRRHMAEEDRHISLYCRAIQKLDQPVLELPLPDVYNEVIRSHTSATFAMSASDDADARRLKLAHFFVIKIGTGIGCGIVCHGEVYRGAAGSAGDVGHICVDQDGPRCHCGNVGCVEVMAAGPAITRMAVEAAQAGESTALAECLRVQGRIDAIDVGEASRAGDASANAIVQRAGSLIGQMLASIVNFFNPSHVFIGGGITRIGPLFLAAVRQSVYQRSLALSTRHLEIQYTPLGAQAGLIGAGVLAMHETLKVRGVAP